SACVLFFFSSRRRHTRFSRDWSSDVCSSDLQVAQLLKPGRHALEVGPGEGEFLAELANRFGTVTALDLSKTMLERAQAFADEKRSEERRVGKECRARRSR